MMLGTFNDEVGWQFKLPILTLYIPLYLTTRSSFSFPTNQLQFIGDADGRTGTFSNCDKVFAETLGISFFNEADFFTGEGLGSDIHNKKKKKEENIIIDTNDSSNDKSLKRSVNKEEDPVNSEPSAKRQNTQTLS